MNLSCLLVENDPDVIANTRKQIAAFPVRLVTAETAQEAFERITEDYFHLAIVDLQLNGASSNNTDGEKVLRFLAQQRPSCLRYLHTKYFLKHSEVVARLLRPSELFVHGVISKVEYSDYLATIIGECAERLQRESVEIEGLDEALNVLSSRRFEESRVRLSIEEMTTVITRLFQRASVKQGDSREVVADIAKVRLAPLEGGRSRSMVLKADIMDRAAQPGIACVIKIGARSEMIEEEGRYARYVKFILALNRRVELLGYSSGDVTGAVCYSFAGDTMENITTLYELLTDSSLRALGYISELFDPTRKEWYKRVSEGQDLARFFSSTFGMQPMQIALELKGFAEALPQEVGRVRGDRLILPGAALTLPNRILGSGKLRRDFNACIVHGDLNARNIIVPKEIGKTAKGNLVLIDYRHTGPGPAAIDFASMEASIREASTPTDLSSVVKCVRYERLIWKAVWDNESMPSEPFWAQASVSVGRKLRENFPSLSYEEYAATCLLLALRLFRIHQLPRCVRFRLILWIGHLNEVLYPD